MRPTFELADSRGSLARVLPVRASERRGLGPQRNLPSGVRPLDRRNRVAKRGRADRAITRAPIDDGAPTLILKNAVADW